MLVTHSALKSLLLEDMKHAMRTHDKPNLGAIRLILAALKQQEVGGPEGRITLSDEQIITILNKMVKQRRESIVQYEAGNRKDLAQIEANEITVIQRYLPPQLSTNDITQAVSQAIHATGATSLKEMGKVMAVLKESLTGKADMAIVSAQVKAQLSNDK